MFNVPPVFGETYKVGYIGFTFQDHNFLASGVAWFTRWDKGENPDIPKLNLSHVIIVTGDNECVEAYLPRVRRTPLDHYFDNPNNHIAFRKPIGLTPEIGERIAKAAASRIGDSYGISLIVGQLIADSIVGRLLGWITRGWSHRLITGIFEKKNQFICSELGAFVLNEQPEYKGKGVLSKPPFEIDPQMLFEDREIFEPWAESIKIVNPKG